MRHFGFGILGFGLPTLLAAVMAQGAYAAENDSLRQKQQAQERARAMANELASAVLDIQLRQLEENGLQSLPIYRDIAQMRSHIGDLADGEMQGIAQLLIEAQQGTQQQRLARLNIARAKIREVVAQLMAERQRLYRRMQVARLAAEAGQLLALQSKTYETTRSLPERRTDERERLALATIEDQADVHKLYYQLLDALADVSTWGGQVSAAAAEGLRILKAAQVEPELKSAVESIGRAAFGQAANSQQAVIKGLTALVEKLEETQGLIDGDRHAALRLVRELLARQQQLRDRTKQTEFAERTVEPLIDEQTRLQKELNKLAGVLTKFPTTAPLIEQAKAASFEATAGLFEDKKPAALDEQSRVIASLAQIENILQQGIDVTQTDRSADELAEEVVRLEHLKKELELAAQQQSDASQSAANKPQSAAEQEGQVAQTLGRTDALGPFASVIHARLNDAKEQVAEAQQALSDHSAAAAAARGEAADAALAAIKQAQAESALQLADTRRRQKAVELGELARAAEALERASAAEREISRNADQAASQGGLPAEFAAALAAENAYVAHVAAKIGEGVTQTAPSTAKMLEGIQPTIGHVARSLASASDQSGEAGRQTSADASRFAKEAAEQLATAAAELRKHQARAATALESIAGEQLAEAESARVAVEKASESAKSSSPDALRQLIEARRKISEALAEQAKAEGRQDAGAAAELVRMLDGLAEGQDEAESAAGELARGRASSPLSAASHQQEVADSASDLALRSPPDLAAFLEQAARAAGSAARETLGGNAAKATAARKVIHDNLAKAVEAAQQRAKQAAQQPPGELDAAAQASAADKAGQAQKLVGQAARLAPSPAQAIGDLLARAKQRAEEAAHQLAANLIDLAQATQAAASLSLEASAEQLDELLRQLTDSQAEQLAQQAQQAKRLGERAVPVDPSAAAALEQAQQAAHRGAQSSRESQLTDAHRQSQQKLDQAAANLAAREQQLRHDRDLAETLAALAAEQQTAREQIARAVEQLQAASPDSASAAEQIAAAQALQQAQQQFAAAQTATGQGAADVSGQNQVANQPIREGLETASRLNQEPADQGQQAGEGRPGTGERAQESQLGTGMVPANPQITAKQIAGPQANAAAASAMATALKGQGEAQPGEGQGESESPQPSDSQSTAKKGGAAKGKKASANKKADQGDLEKADAADADSHGELGGEDAAVGNVSVENEPWFAKLPPGLRSAIQAKSRGKAPRGYEERLRRYFESID